MRDSGQVLLELFVMFAGGKLLAELSERLRQPAVAGGGFWFLPASEGRKMNRDPEALHQDADRARGRELKLATEQVSSLLREQLCESGRV
jgi:hypothetical protein